MPESVVRPIEPVTEVENTSLSELADGELNPLDAGRLFETLNHSAEMRARWETYHIIGDCLRDISPLKSDLATRISLLLSEEPTILAPRRRSFGKRFTMPAAASLAAMVLVTWGVVNFSRDSTTPRTANQMASVSPDQLSPGARYDVNGYMVAHRDFSPGATMANAAFEFAPETAQ